MNSGARIWRRTIGFLHPQCRKDCKPHMKKSSPGKPLDGAGAQPITRSERHIECRIPEPVVNTFRGEVSATSAMRDKSIIGLAVDLGNETGNTSLYGEA